MNQYANIVAETLGLSEIPNLYDWIGLACIFVFIFLVFVNLISGNEKKNSEKIEQLDIKRVSSDKEPSIQKIADQTKKEITQTVNKTSWGDRLLKGLAQTRNDVWGRVGSILSSSKLTDDQFEEIEEILYSADLAPVMVGDLLDELKEFSKSGERETADFILFIKNFLKSKMFSIQEKVNTDLYTYNKNEKELRVIMIVGVNGAGKTTTIGKLATKLKLQGAKVVVGACDTFRAAAVEQLEVWCSRADVAIVKAKEGADPSGVAFDTVKKAIDMEADYCIIDTAGRLHTASNLMDELAKTKKVMGKVLKTAPHETLLVVDAITGQNALRQAEEFNKTLDLSGLIFTKCDGSSKAGSAVGIVNKLEVPIVYIGVGESVDDINIFDLDLYLDALLGVS